MIDQEMHLPVRDRTAPHNDGIGQGYSCDYRDNPARMDGARACAGCAG